jgi:hypothetical protein
MSSRIALVAGAALASLVALPLSAQQSTGTLRDTSAAKPRASSDAATDSALVELGRAITVLTASVQKVVQETANNPEVRRAALQTAGKAVTLAQRTLDENRNEIERLLAEASRKIAAIDVDERAKQEKTPKSAKPQR